MDQQAGRIALAFVFVLLVVAALSTAAVVALNAFADPYGSVGTHILPTLTTSDRTVKADAIESLEKGPELVVLGSSRSMRYEPEYLEEKTGLRTFNAGVNGIGGTVDVWAMTQFIHEVWPDADPGYLWLLDVEAFVPFKVGARTANEPRLAKYVGIASAGNDPVELAQAIVENRTTMFSLATAKDSVRLILYRDKAAQTTSKFRKPIRADGALVERRWTEKEWKRRWPDSVERYSNLHAPSTARAPTQGPGVLREDPEVHERAGRDAADRAHADQPQAAQGGGPSRLGEALRGGRELSGVAARASTTSSSSTSPTRLISMPIRTSGTTACT